MTLLHLLLLAAWGQDPKLTEDTVQAEIIEQHLEVVDLKLGLMALDYFLTDEEEFKKIQVKCECDLEWIQPSLDEYKPQPKSLLPPEVLALAGEEYVYPDPVPPEVKAKPSHEVKYPPFFIPEAGTPFDGPLLPEGSPLGEQGHGPLLQPVPFLPQEEEVELPSGPLEQGPQP